MTAGRTLPALKELLAGIIDYAGLFPPAKLPMDAAIQNYSRYRGEAESWMLGRFICPAARLSELANFIPSLFSNRSPLIVAALGRGGNSATEFLTHLDQDLKDIATFRGEHGDRVVVDVLEVKLPEEVVVPSGGGRVRDLVSAAADRIEAHGPPTLMPYYEATLTGDWRERLTAVFEGLYEDASSDAVEARDRCSPAGFKLRTGGLDAAAFPTCEQIAFVLAGCRKFDLPLKFTAGLHHPVRRYHPSVQTQMHGFLNVVFAALFAFAADWPDHQLLELLADEDAHHFHLHEDGAGWEKQALDAAAIHRLRQEYGFSFGSCSFDEPRDDLRTLGWL